jgi:hypothetical protein
MLFRCVSCPTTWCEDHLSKECVALGVDPQLEKLGYRTGSASYYVICGTKECLDYYEQHVKIRGDDDAHRADTQVAAADSGPSLEELLLKSAKEDNEANGAKTEAQEAQEDEKMKTEPVAARRQSPRKPSPPPPSATAATAAASSSAAAAAPAPPAAPAVRYKESCYTSLSDRLRGRLKKILQHELNAARVRPPGCLGDIHSIRERFLYIRDDSTLLDALHFMLLGEEADIPTQSKGHILAWRGLTVGASKFAAGEFYARCFNELRQWHRNSVNQLAGILGLATQTPPSEITSGPNKGRMSHTEPRGFNLGDPEECVLEHVICFLMAPRPSSQLLRFEYMQRSVEKDAIWAEEMRIAEETGIPRPKKPKPVKPPPPPPPPPVVAPPPPKVDASPSKSAKKKTEAHSSSSSSKHAKAEGSSKSHKHKDKDKHHQHDKKRKHKHEAESEKNKKKKEKNQHAHSDDEEGEKPKKKKAKRASRLRMADRLRRVSGSSLQEKICYGPSHEVCAGAWLPLDFFEPKRHSLGGVSSKCRTCKRSRACSPDTDEEEEEEDNKADEELDLPLSTFASPLPPLIRAPKVEPAGAAAAAASSRPRVPPAAAASASAAAAAPRAVAQRNGVELIEIE